MTEIPKCPTCGGTCSAPDVLGDDDVTGGPMCRDDWHKMADYAPTAFAMLRLLMEGDDVDGHYLESHPSKVVLHVPRKHWSMAAALLAAAPEVKP